MSIGRIPSRVLIAGGLVIATLLDGDASAQTKPPPLEPSPSGASESTVEPSLDDGDRLRKDGELVRALQVFRATRDVNDSARCQRAIAELEDQLGQFGLAYVEYARLLDRHGASLTPRTRKTVEKRLRELDELTGMLIIESLQPSAAVYVDGRPIPTELLSRPLRLTRGERKIRVEQPGYEPATLTLSIGATISRAALALEPVNTQATLTVSATTTEAAFVLIDGQRLGPLPLQIQLPEGEHVVAADGPLVYAPPQTVRLSPKEASTVALTLIPKPSILEVDPVVSDAVLYVDGRSIGAGPRTLELPPGRHTLELRRPSYRTQKLIYDAPAGQRRPLRAGPYVLDTTPAPPSQPGPSQPPPAKPQPSATKAADATNARPFVGFYGDVIVPVTLGGPSTHGYSTQCPASSWHGTCTASGPKGGGLGLRLGYFYEWVGLELMGMGAIDVTTASLDFPPVSTVSQEMLELAGRNVYVRAGGLLGGGLRVTTPFQGLRLTVGADYVYVMRRIVTIPDSVVGTSLTYSVPGYFLDGGIEIGGTPGARFYLGAFLLIETAHDLVLNRDLAALGLDPSQIPPELLTTTMYRGRQYFFGPLIGVAFGH